MGKTRKREIRRQFRDAVFERDGYRCVVCGFESSPEQAEHELDAHHITPREDLPNGGYVAENGVSLCDPSKTGKPLAHGCHYKAEQILLRLSRGWTPGAGLPKHPEDWQYECTPEALYKAIGSSHEKAMEASRYLK
jgi:rubredoxin